MRARRRRIPAAVFVTALLSSLTLPAHAAPVPGQRFQDWSVECEAIGGAQAETRCFLVQKVRLDERARQVLSVVVGYFPPEGEAGALFRLPLGVTLTAGLTLGVDDENLLRVPFVRCDPNGCLAPVTLGSDLLARFRGGRNGRVVVADANGKTVAIPFSLLGFTKGFASLK